MSRRKRVALAAGVLLLVLLAYLVWFALRVTTFPVPPKIEAAAQYEVERSTVTARIGVPLAQLKAGLERDLPKTLMKIDERVEECVPQEKVSLFGADLFKTPRLGCSLVGEVTRGKIVFGGRGPVVTARVPLSAVIEIQDIGDVIKKETATATANMRLSARLAVSEDWQLEPDIKIGYSWANEPGIDVLGQRVKFTGPADRKLAQLIPQVERKIEARIRAFKVRHLVEEAWRDGFDTLSINRKNPPVWLRVAPLAAGVDQLEVAEGELAVDVTLAANLELFVGDAPDAFAPTELGPNLGASESQGFQIRVPVLADFAQLEPVLLRALKKLAKRGIEVEGLAKIETEFHSVTIFATKGNRIAVGVEASITPNGNFTDRVWRTSRGTVWLTALPITKANSETVRISELEVFGDMETMLGDTLALVLASNEVKAVIETELVEDFKNDYDDVLGKAQKGLSDLELGRLDLNFAIDNVEHGPIQVTGSGLFMPVTAKGKVATKIKRVR